MATTKAGTGEVSPTRSLSFDDFVQVAVRAATAATKDLPGHHPIWIGIIIRPPDINPQIVGGGKQQ